MCVSFQLLKPRKIKKIWGKYYSLSYKERLVCEEHVSNQPNNNLTVPSDYFREYFQCGYDTEDNEGLCDITVSYLRGIKTVF